MEYKSQNVICQNCRGSFTIEPDDFSFYEKIKVPPPTFCHECRNQRRLSWRNDTSLYNSKCNLCNKSVVTIYSPDAKINIFCNKCWWGDGWDSMDYSVDYDFSRNFFEQFNDLVKKVPHLSTINDNGVGSINSEYTQDFYFAKNCYMVFLAWKIENVMYSYYLIAGKDMMDCMNVVLYSEWLYECIQPEECHKVKYSMFVVACMDSQFLYDCRNCSNCFMCGGLRNKKYCFKNKQYSKEEYQKILDSYRLDTFSGVERASREFEEFILKIPRKFSHLTKCLNCTGDLLMNGKNSKYCFNVQSPENSKWIDNSDTTKDCYDMATGGELSECYECITCDHSNRNFFGIFSLKNQNVEYTQHCHNSKYLFGCVDLRNKSYCILNKQYTKEEYFAIREKIIKNMELNPYTDKNCCIYKYGEFYPSELSYFGYNETVAMERMPIEREYALMRGLNWQENLQKTTGKETIKPKEIPDSINDISESIVNEILVCIECFRNYKIILNELSFYKQMSIPIPRRCFYCRHKNRINKRNPFKLWHRKCMKAGCEVEFETSYAPDRPEIVYCERCYQQEVY